MFSGKSDGYCQYIVNIYLCKNLSVADGKDIIAENAL